MDEKLLDAALTTALINFVTEIEVRRADDPPGVMLSLHDIYADTRKTIKALVRGELDPQQYMDSTEEEP